MCISLHFCTLTNNNRLEAQIQSSCKLSCNSSDHLNVLVLLNSFASSMKRTQCDFTLLGRSFACIYSINSTGPNTDPCGTPEVTLDQQDDLPFTVTHWCWSVKKSLIHLCMFPPIPKHLIFLRSLMWGTDSNAFCIYLSISYPLDLHYLRMWLIDLKPSVTITMSYLSPCKPCLNKMVYYDIKNLSIKIRFLLLNF